MVLVFELKCCKCFFIRTFISLRVKFIEKKTCKGTRLEDRFTNKVF